MHLDIVWWNFDFECLVLQLELGEPQVSHPHKIDEASKAEEKNHKRILKLPCFQSNCRDNDAMMQCTIRYCDGHFNPATIFIRLTLRFNI